MTKHKNIINNIVFSLLFLMISITSFTGDLDDYKSFLLGDIEGNVYQEVNSEELRPLASTTKIMTSLLTLERIKNGEITMDTMVPVSSFAASVPYGIKLVSGKEYSVKDLLKATIIRSSNNAAEALGEFNGNGNVQAFVDSMNRKAIELGLNNLHYCTPHGLPPEDTGKCRDTGTATDLYKLSQYLLKTHPEYLEISKNSVDYIDNGNIKLTSTNHLLGKVEGVDGLKTGYYRAAGSNIVLTAKRNDTRIIAIIMGASKAINRDTIGATKIDVFYTTPSNEHTVITNKSIDNQNKDNFVSISNNNNAIKNSSLE